MSTELSNGVIIPEEYSDDWYDEMSINLRKLNDVITAASDNATDIQRLDTDKANQSDLTALTSRVSQNETDIIALQTAVSGALKREIVQSLPTEDISTTTIYMIRNSQSSGTNIYDEYMYINNLWELIGTSATDFSNYYTKNETDNLLSAKANQTDLTSLSGRVTQNETNITALQTAVSGALKREIVQSLPTQDISTTTIYMIRNTTTSGDNIYDEYMYINNLWELIGTSATDFSNYYTKTEIDTLLSGKADDNSVVHTSGNETINGVKSFINYFWGKNLSGQTVDLNDCVDAYGGAIHYYYAVSNYTNISNKPENKPFILESKTVRYVSSVDYIYYQKIYTADYNAPPSIYTRYYRSGSSSWSNWVKDTDKFVTTNTNQTISGNKTFSSINGVEPSSLGMPNVNINSFVDISGYFTNTGTGETNTYSVIANGWIYLRLSNISECQAEIYDSSNNRLYAVSTSGSIEQIMIPVVSGVTFQTQWATGSAVTVNIARFIPCQGNI